MNNNSETNKSLNNSQELKTNKIMANTQQNNAVIVFAYPTSDITNPKSFNKGVTLEILYNIITNDKPANYDKIGEITINGLNNNVDVKKIKQDIAPYKMKLPFALFSGYQATGHDNKNLIYNGCIQIDIDIKEKGGDKKALEVKEALSKLPYIALATSSKLNKEEARKKALIQKPDYWLQTCLNQQKHRLLSLISGLSHRKSC